MKASTKATRFLESLSIPEGPKAGQAMVKGTSLRAKVTFMPADPPQTETG